MKPPSHGIYAGLFLLVIWGVAGCTTLSTEPEVASATTADVQHQAWGEVKDLSSSLARLDPDRNPGVAALVQDLQKTVAAVEDLAGPHYDTIDAEKLILKNPNFWRAMLEMDPADPTLLVLEGMIAGAAGEVENSSDLLELVRAGPLLDEELDRKLVRQRRTISKWRWSSPGVDLLMAAGLPPDERWEPVKRAQMLYPDSPSAALAVLRMRCDLAEVELIPDHAEQRMRDKILIVEPEAVAVLEAHRPLWGALITATGEASDAARRIAEMIQPDSTGLVNFSADDFARLLADLNRIGATDWALRAARLQMAQRGEHDAADIEIWRQLLPELIGEGTANEMIEDWENGRMSGVALYGTMPEAGGTEERPMNALVGGHYERVRRDAALMFEGALPIKREQESALLTLAMSARTVGNWGEAEEALNQYAAMSSDKLRIAQERLSLAMARGDEVGAAQAVAEVRRFDRRLVGSSFVVGNAEIMAGDWAAAAEAFSRGAKNEMADPVRRGFAMLRAFGAAKLAGEDRSKSLREALGRVEEDAWIAKLLRAALGEMGRDQLLAAADEGRDYIVTGQRCEAFFALAFAPGQTIAGRRSDLIACRDTGMVGYVEYEFARMWLRH